RSSDLRLVCPPLAWTWSSTCPPPSGSMRTPNPYRAESPKSVETASTQAVETCAALPLQLRRCQSLPRTPTCCVELIFDMLHFRPEACVTDPESRRTLKICGSRPVPLRRNPIPPRHSR